MDFQEKYVIVTGAASGIGKQAALQMAARGATIALVDINEEGAQSVAQDIHAIGCQTLVVQTDLASVSAIQTTIEHIASRFGRIDAVANIAAIYPSSDIFDVTEEYWDRMIAIDLRGVFFTCQAVMKVMLSQGAGAIVNIASGAAFKPIRGQAVYSAAKGGIVAMSRVFALEGARKGVRVNVVAPGPTASETLLGNWGVDGIGAYEQNMVPGRMMKPAEVAEAITFLCSDAATGLNGAILNVNGGDYMPSG